MRTAIVYISIAFCLSLLVIRFIVEFEREMETQTFKPPSEEVRVETRYDIELAKYSKALQEYRKQFQALRVERVALSQELEDIGKLAPKASTMSDAELDDALNRLEKWREQKSDLQRREANLRKNRPIPPTDPYQR